MERELPKYLELVNWIKQQVIEGGLSYGDKFYSENELASMFSLSRQTVRQAVGILEKERIVERRRGSGTYVIYGGFPNRDRTMNIGVISTYLDDYIFTSIIKGIETVLTDNGYSMQLAFTHNRIENETRALRVMLEKSVDGIIVEPTKSGLPNPNLDIYQQIISSGIPLIFFNAYYPALPLPHVSLDDRKAGRIATQCLLDAGHRSIAGIFQADDLQGHLRYAGYVDALREAGVDVHSQNILWYTTEDIKYIPEDFYRINRILKDCTGLVCYNDQIAFQVCRELRKQSIEIPQQLSVVSIDNSDLAALCEVPLTSVAHPMKKLGKTVANNLLKLIEDKSFKATVDFEPKLVTRQSVRSL
ncbi:MAG: GntR family transcriptional regulator [Angelakisella sp.]|nr:GntR family transcriptional regulator [Angelakisella sp.]